MSGKEQYRKYSSRNDYKFHEPGKWINNKNWLENWFI